jgi:hypothetical protein
MEEGISTYQFIKYDFFKVLMKHFIGGKAGQSKKKK